MINFKNLFENLLIVLIVMIATAFITYKATLSSALESNKATTTALIPTLIEAIKKETTAIQNTTTNQIDFKKLKVKNSDSLTISIDSKQPSENVIKSEPKLKVEYKEGDRFGEFIVVKFERLTRRQRKRLGVFVK